MAEFSKERRRLLMSTAAILSGTAAAATVLGARPARAWETYKIPTTSGLGLLYANHCGGQQSEHEAIKAELQKKLANDPSATSETATCPFCGCAITVDRGR